MVASEGLSSWTREPSDSICCLAGHGRAAGRWHGTAETVPCLSLGRLGRAWPLLAGPFFGSSRLVSQAWPHLAGGPVSSLGNQGSLCVQTPSSYSHWHLLDGRHMQRAPCQGVRAWNWTPAVPTSSSPRKLPKSRPQRLSHGSVTALSAGSPDMLSPSHREEAPASGLQLRGEPLRVRPAVPQWPKPPLG